VDTRFPKFYGSYKSTAPKNLRLGGERSWQIVVPKSPLTEYGEILQSLIDQCPVTMAICNKAGKTPYVIHLETRKAAKPDWEGLEDEYQQAQPDPAHSVAPNSAKNSPERIEQDGSKGQATASGENPSAEPIPAVSNLKRSASPTTPRDDKLLKKDTRPNFLSTMKRVSQQAAVSSHINPVVDYCRPLAVEIASRLLEECCSRKTFKDARKCLFGEGQSESAPRLV
jgi:hypothetical protein